ncbi:unnamed protein product, partial [Ectocarpus sp. 8 AP-2014]
LTNCVDDECCVMEASCDDHVCADGNAADAGVPDGFLCGSGSCTDDQCCVGTCAAHTCGDGNIADPALTAELCALTDCVDDECCVMEASCDDHVCAEGNDADPGVADGFLCGS